MTAVRQRPRPAARTADLSHGYYRIVAASRGAVGQAVAYAGTLKVDEAVEETVDEAVAALRARLDQRTERFEAARDPDGWPSPEEYREALRAIPDEQSALMVRLLRAHGRRPEALATVNDLGRIVGLDPAEVWKQYGRLGRKLNAHLRFGRLRKSSAGQRYVVDSFATVSPIEGSEVLAIRLRPEIVEAVS
ncbi:hypothetical protein [Brevundimonas sp. DC300-4]|uniref:hypothetical protein n=1 Tax=Brevundimonas sp. DC300-4 TaxID=2804594 RepID=UPI003CFA9C1D